MKKKPPKILHKVTTLSTLPAKGVKSLRNLPRRRNGQNSEVDAKFTDALQNLPRITNETVAEHREEVLSSARKYIYPLSHSKRRVVTITTSLLVAAVILFFAYCVSALYKFQSTSTFIYGVAQVIPFPVARAGSSWVSYESYLFELRHTMHYYQTQQHEDFNTMAGKAHLAKLKQDALAQVIQDAYVKQLAGQHHVSVSVTDVNNEVTLVRDQNRLGSNDQVFRNVLSEFWGWTTDDFKRELKQQLLAQKVVSVLDTGTQSRAKFALTQLQGGADFATVAAEDSDDPAAKTTGGSYGIQIDANNHDIAPQVLNVLLKLQPGQHSGIINTGFTLEIDKVTQASAGSVTASRVVFNFKPIATYTDPVMAAHKPHDYIKLKP